MARNLIRASNQFLYRNNAVLTAVPITMACWINVTDITTNMMAMSIASSLGGDYFSLLANGIGGGDPIYAQLDGDAGWDGAATTAGFTANTWHHVCGVFATNSLRSAYLDGGNKGTDVNNNTPALLNATGIGAQYDGAGTFYLDGRIAEPAFWNVALGDDEVEMLSLGYSPLLIRPQSLVRYSPLIRGNDICLISGQNYDNAGVPTIGPHPRVMYPDFN